MPGGTRLLDAVLAAGLPIAQGCRGESLCGRCGVRVTRGASALAAESATERDAKRRNRVEADLRLACCVSVTGDLEVTANYWGRSEVEALAPHGEPEAKR